MIKDICEFLLCVLLTLVQAVIYVVAAIISVVGTLLMLCFMIVLLPFYLTYKLLTGLEDNGKS